MKRLKTSVYIVICTLVWQYAIFFQPVASAEDSLGEGIDCTDVSVDYLEDSTLTREDRLRLMDKAFYESLNKFELCQEAKKMANAAGGSSGGANGSANGGESGGESGDNGGGTAGETGDLSGETGSSSAGQSVASSTMSGTEAPKKYPASDTIGGEESGALQNSQDIAEVGKKTGGNLQRSNGKLPEDIPSAKNDDALAAQIRYAAENETDPVKSKQLWNEYRKYKGMATK